METPAGPLAGTRVVALEQSVAGPLASRILADLGADVIKIEAPQGDFSRHWDSLIHGYSSHFTWLSRRKRSIIANLSTEEGRRMLNRLLADADVLITNMSPASLDKLGLDPETIGATYPHLISCQISGYGRVGRMRARKAYDMLIQAEAGLMSVTGTKENPSRIGASVCDIGTGLYASSLILAALFERERSGHSRAIDLSMFEAMTEFIGPNLTAHANANVIYKPAENRHNLIVPYGMFKCSDDWIVLAVEQDSEWLKLCHNVLLRPELAAEEKYATNELRLKNRATLEPELDAMFAAEPAGYWLARLQATGIAYARVNSIADVWEHEVVADLALRRPVRLPNGQTVWVPTGPAERAFGRGTEEVSVPDLDQQRAEIVIESHALDGM